MTSYDQYDDHGSKGNLNTGTHNVASDTAQPTYTAVNENTDSHSCNSSSDRSGYRAVSRA